MLFLCVLQINRMCIPMDHISASQIVFQDVTGNTGQMISGGGILSVGVL